MQENQNTSGFDAVDLVHDPEFALRRPRHHDYRAECNAVYLIGTALTGSAPDLLPQLLCDAALEICGAQSTGISLEETTPDGRRVFRWAATAGPFVALADGVMPGSSPCGVCLDRNAPQLVAVHQAYYDRLGIRGPLVAQAILIPWHSEGTNGTFWAVQHTPNRNFDQEDFLLLKHLVTFASIAMRHLQREVALRNETAHIATGRLIEELADRVHNPLQATVNSLYLASRDPEQASSYVAAAIRQVVRISDAVEELFHQHTRYSAQKVGRIPPLRGTSSP